MDSQFIISNEEWSFNLLINTIPNDISEDFICINKKLSHLDPIVSRLGSKILPKRRQSKPNKCIDCPTKIQNRSKRCKKCYFKFRFNKKNKCINCNIKIDSKATRCKKCYIASIKK